MLAIGCLDGGLRFFSAGGTQKFKDRKTEGAPQGDACSRPRCRRAGHSALLHRSSAPACRLPVRSAPQPPRTKHNCPHYQLQPGDPLSLAFFSDEYLLMAGTDKCGHSLLYVWATQWGAAGCHAQAGVRGQGQHARAELKPGAPRPALRACRSIHLFTREGVPLASMPGRGRRARAGPRARLPRAAAGSTRACRRGACRRHR